MEVPPTITTPKKSVVRETLGYIITALIIVVPIRAFIAQPFVVNGASMDTTFKDGEYLIVDEISYRFEKPERGDVIVFRYPLDPKKYFIKRIIGLPSETVKVSGETITITNTEKPEGFVISEPYTHSQTIGNISTTLRNGEYFVMGDNRVVSLDSRSWGALPEKDIIGKPFVRLLPLSRIDLFPGEISTSTVE
ncbi:MAG: signal peptidase I [Candidatus Taylorbacteria bacterium CG10_big_fil_rev_8_21_14_0_10_41_48]|uniref:Signal peptidase I n=1 Tax=Candidatus Taylorbacteria bacterium CG10_big_fil_rev_8_21_14_0_10_41_48 TaxID=1975024 RepID=A0A2M8LBI7_9BACT|nr:MAG: signal peptidase I [Candidatus Taylorbacteria bacterium CG10_big_fil_rev_8_21_14_0_10_41_48]